MKSKKRLTVAEEREGALQFLVNANNLFHAAARAIRHKAVAHHVISAGLGVQDALFDLRRDPCKRRPRAHACKGAKCHTAGRPTRLLVG